MGGGRSIQGGGYDRRRMRRRGGRVNNIYAVNVRDQVGDELWEWGVPATARR